MAVAAIVITDAFPVIATHPTDSPYVVLGHPPKRRSHHGAYSVSEEGSVKDRVLQEDSCSIIDERFL